MLSSIQEYLPGPPTLGNIWSTLGLTSHGTTLHDLIHRGLPYEYFNLIANNLQVEREVISQAIGVSPASLARRAKTGCFSTVESDRLIALIAVFEHQTPLSGEHSRLNGCPVSLDHYTLSSSTRTNFRSTARYIPE